MAVVWNALAWFGFVVMLGLWFWEALKNSRLNEQVSALLEERGAARIVTDSFGDMETDIAKMEAELASVVALAKDWERKFWEQNGIIAGVIGERDRAFAMHHRSSAMAGVAQDMMMRELTRCLALINAQREASGLPPLTTQPQLREVYESFLAERERAKVMVPADALPPAPPPS